MTYLSNVELKMETFHNDYIRKMRSNVKQNGFRRKREEFEIEEGKKVKKFCNECIRDSQNTGLYFFFFFFLIFTCPRISPSFS